MRIPASYRKRLAAVARRHRLGSADALARFFLDEGLNALGAAAGATPERLEALVSRYGYSSVEEAIEHLLERGLATYDTDDTDGEALKRRLRGLGYIE